MTYAVDAYAGAAYALTEEPDAVPPPSPFPVVPYPCPCGSKWKVYACQLATGRVRAILRPVSIDVQGLLDGVGQGTLIFPTRNVRARDIWPGLTSIYVTFDDEVVFAGYVEQFDGTSTIGGGTVQVGLKSLEGYLYRRTIKTDLTYTSLSQTMIGAALVGQAIPNGIPLTGLADDSAFSLDRSYLGAERPFIGEQIENLVNSIDGPDWTLISAYAAGVFSSRMFFQDRAGVDRDTIFKSDREGSDYGLIVDAVNLATNVSAFAITPDASSPTTKDVSDPAHIYPQWDATPSFGTTTDSAIAGYLDEQANGYLQENREPAATPSFTLAGDSIPISDIRLGDTAEFHINQSAVTFHGRAKVVGITYRGAQGEPLKRILGLEPVGRASGSVLNAVTTEECVVCR